MSTYKGSASGAPPSVISEALVVLAYLVKTKGPFTVPPVEEMVKVLGKGNVHKHTKRDAKGNVIESEMFFTEGELPGEGNNCIN